MQAIFLEGGQLVLKTAKSLGFQRFLLATMCLGLLAAPAHASENKHKPEKERPVATTPAAVGEALAKPSAELRPGLAGSFLSGRFAKHNQDLQEAARYLEQTLAHDPSNEALQQETMRMELLAGNVEAATKLAKTLAQNKNNDPLIASLMMLEAVKADDFVTARTTIEQAPNVGLFGLIRPVMLEWIAVAEEDKKHVVNLQAAIDKAGFFAPFINYHAGLMNDVIGNQAAAKAAYTKSSLDPAITPYRVVEAIANFYARQGQPEQAQAVYDAYAKANPQSTLIPDTLGTNAPIPKPLVGDAKQGLAELFFTTASILFGEDATQDTFLYLRIALDLRPNLPPAQLMLANLYEQVEDYKQAIATYDTIPEGSVFHRRAEVRKALNYEALGQKAKAMSVLEALASRYPNDATALITKGDMERDAKNYDAAAETYSSAIARTEPLTASDWPLLYARGISYERSGDWSSAEADFNRALVLSPEQPDVLNYLAYSWLTMNKNLGQAREYLEIASSQRPDDAHIIDSVGWAYYLSGDFNAAVKNFERAIELLPDDVTVNDHLGDAYWRVGRVTEAKFQWERALAFKPDKETIEALNTKLSNGLPAFVLPAELSAKTPEPSKVATTPARIEVQ
ncbi:MAG: tetratricopeptide repeat protein [Rickettsiales bacterium]|nr:tetratricopeptide repeat protein [Rickettsiales bacterium]